MSYKPGDRIVVNFLGQSWPGTVTEITHHTCKVKLTTEVSFHDSQLTPACPYCDGEGSTECDVCNGSGSIKILIPSANWEEGERETWEDCPKCFADKRLRCVHCKGTGKKARENELNVA